jgi:hypothetical protein
LGSERKMLRDFSRAARRVSRNFMGSIDRRWLSEAVLIFLGRLALNFGSKSHVQVVVEPATNHSYFHALLMVGC